MVLDTSAIVAMIANEPERAAFQHAMLEAQALAISAVTVLETPSQGWSSRGARNRSV